MVDVKQWLLADALFQPASGCDHAPNNPNRVGIKMNKYLTYVSQRFWANYGVKSFLNSLSGHLLVSKTIAYNNNNDGNRGKENKKNLKIFKFPSLSRLKRLGQLGTFTEETLNLFTLFTCALQQQLPHWGLSMLRWESVDWLRHFLCRPRHRQTHRDSLL